VKSRVSLYIWGVSAWRRLSTPAAVVVLGALVLTPGAQACSCAPQRPSAALRAADAAIVARLIEVIPRDALHADFRYRVRRVYRGARSFGRGDVISVRSARRAAACGLPPHQERPVGLFLVHDDRGRWVAGICSTIAPRRLARLAKRTEAAASGSGAASSSCAS
jgi:hypothetical protein